MAIEYVPYRPTVTEGQAVLGNFERSQRLLRYRHNEDVERSIQRGMPLYETSLEETVGDTNSGNMIIRGECRSACAFLKKRIDAGEMDPVDLVYVDPPFASGADYAKQVYIRRDPKLAEQAHMAEAQLEDEEVRSFEEVMYSDIWDKERYLDLMHENLLAIKAVMSPNASIYVHLDYHIGHYVKVLLDEVFGESSFQNEIVWKRSSAHSDRSGFANIHDSIFYYALGEEFYYDTQYVPYTEEYIKSHYKHKEEDGRL